MAVWGVWDTQDGCWLGDAVGPKRLPTEDLARAAAQIVGVQLGWRPGRAVARQMPPAMLVQEKDEVKTQMSTREALRKIEDGAL